MRRFLIFSLLLMPAFATGQTENPATEKRCKCRARRDFLLEKSDSCFTATRAEADRFFNCRCWDEAMSLYRAAKSCTDANQNARSEMNRRIEACRDSAEQELRHSEQAARRQFLHATASNLADDAQELLKKYDRSMAYRLADFAGRYVAPEPNADCLQALLDAWYYLPWAKGNMGAQVPFCYQLAYDLGGNVQTRFVGNKLLYAFAPASSTLFAWDTKSWEKKTRVQLEKGLAGFDVSLDGRTLLFFSDKKLLFWRSQRDTFQINVPNMSRYCFSADGEKFFFLNGQESKIYVLDLHSLNFIAQRDQKNMPRRGEKRPEPRWLANVTSGIVGMAFHDGRLWLAVTDGIVVLEQSKDKEQQWVHSPVIAWGGEMPYDLRAVQIFPTRQAIWAQGPDSFYYYRLPMLADSQQTAVKIGSYEGSMLALRAGDPWLSYFTSSTLHVSADTGFVNYACFIQPGDEFQPLSGAIAPDKRWLAAATNAGALKIWALHDSQNSVAASLPSNGRIVFNQRGDQFACNKGNLLQMFDTDQPGRPFFEETVQGEEVLIDAMGEGWAAWRSDGQLLRIKNGRNGQKWEFQLESGMDAYLPIAFDETGQFVAYAADYDSVVVCSLENGEVRSSQPFSGSVMQLRFVPGSGELMVVHSFKSGFYAENQTAAKVWDPSSSANRPRPLRVHGYTMAFSKTSPRGDQAAFSSGTDILVFRLDNLLDERARIRARDGRTVRSFAFHPDGSALAASYDDGLVILWDLSNGEARFRLKAADDFIEDLSFSADGTRLRLLTMSGLLFSRDISPDLIGAAAQNENRQLAAFTPEQIREHGLEQALDASGNFQQLAESGDLPLIRSFFEYYRQQALSSNNIERVKTYFESAASLYSKLQDQAAQRALRPFMLEIYEDYNWKLLLREKNAEAQRVLNDFNRLFGKPFSGIKMGAHTALLRNDLPAAARQYAEWTMRMHEDAPHSSWAMDSLQQQFRQLVEYDLLTPEQLDCICGLYADISRHFRTNISQFCPEKPKDPKVFFDAETAVRWDIFQKLNTGNHTGSHSKKVRLYQSALDDIEALYRKKPAQWRDELEKTTLLLAQAYSDQGDFERENEYATSRYQLALRRLGAFGKFKNREAERLQAIAYAQLKLGTYLLATDQLSDAAKQFELILEVAGQLTSSDTTTRQTYGADLRSNSLPLLGTTRLLEGNAPAARAVFLKFREEFPYWNDSLFLGLVDLLEGNETQALVQFRSIDLEYDLGWTLFIISRLGRRLPERRAQLEAFSSKLRENFLAESPDRSAEQVDFSLASQQDNYFFVNKQIGAALEWQEKKLVFVKNALDRPGTGDYMKEVWAEQLLLQSYYLLHQSAQVPASLPQSIAYAEKALTYLDTALISYEYRGYIEANRAHAFLLRNQPGDREAAIATYRAFVGNKETSHNTWELLQKDFRDLHRTGTRWPDLKGVIEAVKPPGVELSAEDWQEMGAL